MKYSLFCFGIVVFPSFLFLNSITYASWTEDGNGNTFFNGGKVGIGITSSPIETLHVKGNAIIEQDGSYPTLKFTGYSNTNWHGGFFLSQRARGTKSAPLAVQNGDQLFNLDAWGYAGSGLGFKRSAQVSFLVAGDVVGESVPSKISFKTVAIGGGGITERMLISGTGNIGIGTANPTEKLEVAGNIKALGICIGGDCKTAWPTGTGGSADNWGTQKVVTDGTLMGDGTAGNPLGIKGIKTNVTTGDICIGQCQ